MLEEDPIPSSRYFPAAAHPSWPPGAWYLGTQTGPLGQHLYHGAACSLWGAGHSPADPQATSRGMGGDRRSRSVSQGSPSSVLPPLKGWDKPSTSPQCLSVATGARHMELKGRLCWDLLPGSS